MSGVYTGVGGGGRGGVGLISTGGEGAYEWNIFYLSVDSKMVAI